MYYTSKSVYEFISKQTKDPIVERKKCKISGTEFPIYKSDLEFYDKISPVLAGKKYQIPTPSLCTEERQRRRLSFRNERKLYKRKCDATGENIISIYSPDKNYKVYKQDFWWSDKWDALDCGRDFDNNKNFFLQIDELVKAVPHMTVFNVNNQNSEYNNYLNDSKNCYLCMGSGFLEDCCFCKWTYESKSLLDSDFCSKGENSYMNTNCEGFYKSPFSYESKNISDCYYCFDCENCKNCIGCVGLRDKEYYIFNEKFTKENYLEISSNLPIGKDNDFFAKKVGELKEAFGHSNSRKVSSENCFGNDIKNCKNSVFGFELENVENSKYSREIFGAKNVMDFTNGGLSELSYEFHGFGWNYNVLFSLYTGNCKNLYYCAFCQNNCEYCFGCVGLRNKSYCIFNKQYTREEYEKLVPQIIERMMETGERGEFFDPSLSPFGYNETVAQEYFPLTREEALARGYKRQDNNYDPVIPAGADVLKGDQIPADISTVTDEILKKILVCEVSGRPFRIIKQELEFYKKHNLSLPRKHPDIRHEERMKQRPPRELHLRNCDKCGIEMLSVYDQNYNGKIYCEACYQKEVFA